ncbi:MAG: glycosyltransferase [Desulfovibrionaceae bacterium]|nr:glycosyltransferase [Desulfovibrionaceae bacterium]
MRVHHLITGLGAGGAETSLYRLLKRLDRGRFACRVTSLTPDGQLAPRIRSLRVPVDDLGLTRSTPSLSALLFFRSHLRSWKADILQTWMYHADLLGLLAGCCNGARRVVWNLRCSSMELEHYSPMTRRVRSACALLSRFPAAVVSNSRAAVDYHRALGYRARRFEVIPNGVDSAEFRPDAEARCALRAEWGAEEGDPVFGLVARWDHMKGHDVFFRAARRVLERMPRALFVLCGEGADRDNARLARLSIEAGVRDRCRLLGRRVDVNRVTAALDVACLSSHGESFPNVVVEAMACGVPCAVTDVGDAALMVGDTGRVVPVRDPAALAEAMVALASLEGAERERLGRAARERAKAEYSLEAMAARYMALYEDLAGRSADGTGGPGAPGGAGASGENDGGRA